MRPAVGCYRFLSVWDPTDIDEIIPPIVVVTCFLQRGDRFLALQRARADVQYGLWGIPGGKLENNETPLSGLCRELKEEVDVAIDHESITLLGQALSKTTADGVYGLYLYHTLVPHDFEPTINLSEHLAYRWVSADEFMSLPLLYAQGEAFIWVEDEMRARLSYQIVEASCV